MPSLPNLGPVTSIDGSFRARAERRQREVRAAKGWGWQKTGHWLDKTAADDGRNFVCDASHEAARARFAKGKGVAERTFVNMLSSQAMCFNLFAPMQADLALATRILSKVIPGLQRVTAIDFEHTPSSAIFRDQSGFGGVDCDLRIDGCWSDGAPAVVTVETKFVEPEFSTCSFTDPGRLKPDKKDTPRPHCTTVLEDPACGCLYGTKKKYAYWDRTKELGTLAGMPTGHCPFGGVEWQLWTNHVLAHALAREAGARPRFVVCAPSRNERLHAGEVLASFANRLADKDTVQSLQLEDLLSAIRADVAPLGPLEREWVDGLVARYEGI